VEAAADPLAARAQEGVAATLACRVLVAEDNAVNQLIVGKMLERMGCRVDVVGTGREAVAAARAGAYDVILMDQHMPEQDGIDATREIRRAEGEGRRTAIVALTASALPEDRERCRDAGMDDFLAKPLASAALRAVISRYARIEPCAGTASRSTRRECSPAPPPPAASPS
jgi:CheY-like chemotaxis protein